MKSKVLKVSGSLVQIGEKEAAKLYETVQLGANKITGEIRRLTEDIAWVLVHERADSLKPGDLAECAGVPLQMELGPGLLGGAYDGLGRSLEALYAKTGDQISPGAEAPALDLTKRWSFRPSVTVGTKVLPGDSIGMVQETAHVAHRIMVPEGVSGTVAEVHSGERTIEEVIVIVKAPDGTDHKLTMTQNWPIRVGRPYRQKHRGETQIQTGVDLVQGGTALLTGEMASGQAVLDKLIESEMLDVIVYAASGLPGNECAALIEACKKQAEPKTVLLTSPCDTEAAAQEAVVYRGLTIAAYYRDMGLNTAFIIDNLAAWIDAVSETAERMDEISCEDGLPINLRERLAELFEPAGVVTCLGTEKRQGSLTIIGVLPKSEGLEAIEKALRLQIDTHWITDEEQGGCAND